MAATTVSRKKKAPAKKATKKDYAASYNQYKTFHGQQYTGMKIGRTHHWFYDKAPWDEKKITPDKWEFTFSTVKRRKGKAPEGSGVPVGTEYHWYILSHQFATKLDANSYTIGMKGIKYKLAHKRADKEKWNLSDRGQRKHLIKIFQDMIAELEKEPEEQEAAPEAPAATPGKKKAAKAAGISLNGSKTGARKTAATKRLRTKAVQRRKSSVH